MVYTFWRSFAAQPLGIDVSGLSVFGGNASGCIVPSFRAAAAPLVRRMVVYAGTDDLGSAFLALAAVLFWGGDIVFPAPGTGAFLGCCLVFGDAGDLLPLESALSLTLTIFWNRCERHVQAGCGCFHAKASL